MAISGYSTRSEWCNNGYTPNSPNGNSFGFIGAITYTCGNFNEISGGSNLEPVILADRYLNKLNLATISTGTPTDIKTEALAALRTMTLTDGTTVKRNFPGCIFCCGTI
jgi:hypothetical protein